MWYINKLRLISWQGSFSGLGKPRAFLETLGRPCPMAKARAALERWPRSSLFPSKSLSWRSPNEEGLHPTQVMGSKSEP